MDLKVPSNVNVVTLKFIDIVTFDPLPTDDVHAVVFDIPDDGPYNFNFENTGYGSRYAIENMGSMGWFLHL